MISLALAAKTFCPSPVAEISDWPWQWGLVPANHASTTANTVNALNVVNFVKVVNFVEVVGATWGCGWHFGLRRFAHVGIEMGMIPRLCFIRTRIMMGALAAMTWDSMLL